MDWDTLKAECLACRRCELCTDRTHVVFGQGVQTAEVLFVGEGPGQSEDEQGLPFVGRSGSCWTNTCLPSIWTGAKTATLPTSSNAARPRTVTRCPPRARPVCPGSGNSSSCCSQRSWSAWPHRLPADDPHRFLRDQGARHLCAKERRVVHGHLPPRRPAPAAQNKPAAFADFVALREKIHEVCGHTY